MACVFMRRLLNMVCILLLYLLMHLVPQWLYPFMIFIINKVCIYFNPKSYFGCIFGGEYLVPSSSLLGVALASLLQAIHPFFDTLFGWIYIRSKRRIKSRISWFTWWGFYIIKTPSFSPSLRWNLYHKRNSIHGFHLWQLCHLQWLLWLLRTSNHCGPLH